MLHIFDWPPLVWTLRVALLILVGVSALLFVLVVARYFRWSSVRTMVMADLPRVKSLGGEFAGTIGEVQFADVQDAQFDALKAQLDALTRDVALLNRGGTRAD